MNNFTTSKLKNQEKIKSLTPFQLKIFNMLINAYCKLRSVYISQSTFARTIGCSLITVNRAIKVFKELKLITYSTCLGYRSLYLKPSPSILLSVHDKVLRKILPSLKSLMFKAIGQWFTDFGRHNEPSENVDPEQNDALSNRSSYKSYYTSHTDYDSKGRNSLNSGEFKNKPIKTVNMNQGIPTKKEISDMTVESNCLTISPLMRKITKDLNLSRLGQARLLIYDEVALQATIDKWPSYSYHLDPFLWFEEHCKGYSFQHRLPVHASLLDSMLKRCNINPDASPILKNKKVEISKSNVKIKSDLDEEKNTRMGIGFMNSFIKELQMKEAL